MTHVVPPGTSSSGELEAMDPRWDVHHSRNCNDQTSLDCTHWCYDQTDAVGASVGRHRTAGAEQVQQRGTRDGGDGGGEGEGEADARSRALCVAGIWNITS